MKYHKIIFLLSFLLLACGNNNQEINEFANIYYEIINNQISNSGNKDKIIEGRKKILQKYNVDEKYINNMIEYLSKNPSQWQVFEKELDNIIKSKNR